PAGSSATAWPAPRPSRASRREAPSLARDPCPGAEPWTAECVSLPCIPRDDRRRDRGSVSRTPVNPAVESSFAVFPWYNDEATIASMANLAFVTLDAVGVDGEVIVIDDGSTDDSPHVLKELTDEHPRLRVVTHERNRGYGGALRSGFASATQQWVFYTDGDA